MDGGGGGLGKAFKYILSFHLISVVIIDTHTYLTVSQLKGCPSMIHLNSNFVSFGKEHSWLILSLALYPSFCVVVLLFGSIVCQVNDRNKGFKSNIEWIHDFFQNLILFQNNQIKRLLLIYLEVIANGGPVWPIFDIPEFCIQKVPVRLVKCF